MKLIIKQSNIQEQVSSELIDKLYQITSGGVLTNDSELQGSLITQVTYEDAVVYLRQHFPNLIITANTYYIRFADEEVVSVLTAKGIIPEGGGITTAQASELPAGGGSANEYWFSGNTTIKEFDEIKYFGRLKNGQHQMGQWFTNATNLESVDLTGFTKLFGYRLFDGCKNLEYFHGRSNTPNTLNLEDLTSLNATFKQCLKLYHIASLGSITSIDQSVFTDCTNLETVNLPSSCINLGSGCFKSDSKLHTINLSHITAIGNNTFEGCSSLEYCDGPNSTQGELYLPNLTGTLGSSAFKGCIKLTSVTSLGSITTIGGNAFENCTSLATINFPNTLTSVGKNAFNNTAWYNSQPNGPVYTANVLYKCKNASGAIVIPNNIVSITEGAFLDCSSLTSVTIGSDVAAIAADTDSVFKGCTALSTIVVDSNNAKYDSRDNCNAIIVTSSNTLIAGCQNTIIPNSVTAIDVFAFRYCSGLVSINIPNSVTSIGNCAFQGSGLTSVTIPNSVTSIGLSAFYDTKITSIEFPEGLTTISEGICCWCSALTTAVLPSTTTKIGGIAFSQCGNLQYLTVKALIPPTVVNENMLLNTHPNLVIYVPSSSVDTYKTASGWSSRADRIQAIPTT